MKMAREQGREAYRARKHIVEAPFGWIKSSLGFKSFSLRGVERVASEWNLICTALNLKRMATMIASG